MESLSTGVPVVVCPGFGDQPVNAKKAVQLGVGLQIERPLCDLSEAPQVAAKYRQDVMAALESVYTNPDFKAKAGECASQMQSAGARVDFMKPYEACHTPFSQVTSAESVLLIPTRCHQLMCHARPALPEVESGEPLISFCKWQIPQRCGAASLAALSCGLSPSSSECRWHGLLCDLCYSLYLYRCARVIQSPVHHKGWDQQGAAPTSNSVALGAPLI